MKALIYVSILILATSCAFQNGFSALSKAHEDFRQPKEIEEPIVEEVPVEDEIPVVVEDDNPDIFQGIRESALMFPTAEETKEHIGITTVNEEQHTVEETIVEPLVEEETVIIQETEEEQAETFLDGNAESIVVVADNKIEEPKKTVLQSIEDTVRGKDEPKEAVINGNVLPMWFVYTFAFLFLSILFTMCYLAKQRRWAVRNRD